MRFEGLRGMAFLCAAFPALALAGEPVIPPSAILNPGFIQLMGDFGRPADTTLHREGADGAVVRYQFSDGSRLAVRRSTTASGTVAVNGLIGSGRLGLPQKLAQSAWGMSFLPLGGTVSATYEDIEHWLAASGHSVELNFNPELRGFRFWGTTSPQDVGYQIALLCGIVHHAGMRDVVSGKAAEFGSTLALQIEMNPQLVLARAIGRAASGLGPRYDELPLPSEISLDLSNDLQAISARQLGGPVDMAVVGDIAPDTVAAYFAATCAAGGRSSAPRQISALIGHFETGPHRWTFLKSETDGTSGLEVQVWPTADYGKGDRRRQALNVLADVLRVRLSQRLSSPTRRVVPLVAASTGFASDRFGFFAAAIGKEEPADLVRTELRALLQDPELDAQVAAVAEQRRAARATRVANNAQWAAALAEGLSNPEALAHFEEVIPNAAPSLTQDVREAARWLLSKSQHAEISVLPRE